MENVIPRHEGSHNRTAEKIISEYNGQIPLSSFLKQFFAGNKKYGSRDRKQISSICYDHFRKAAADRLRSLETEFSQGIDAEKFEHSFLQQPDLFIRIRPGYESTVIDKLKSASINYQLLTANCVSLSNSTKLENIIQLDKEAVIQDANSQRVLDYLAQTKNNKQITMWDCCAASGGKSILAFDILKGNVDIVVSDIRESIIANLKKRFKLAGIKNYSSIIADLSSTPDSRLPTPDLLLCDVPCTGSGTWSRTPEQLYFFQKEAVEVYAERQKQIVSHAIPQLKNGGLFFYITCSIFKKENEEIVDFIKGISDLEVIQIQTLAGYDIKADSMFVAVLKRPSSI